jgi:hypothetical protein
MNLLCIYDSIITYGIIFWGNSSNSRKIGTFQKKIVRIMAGAQPRSSCRSLFKQLEVLPVWGQYIFSLMNFIVSNQENFQTNSSIHSINRRNNRRLHRPNVNLSCFQKSTFYAGIFNSLPRSLTILKNEQAKFKLAVRRYLNTHSFYFVDEFFVCTDYICYCFVKCL